MARANVAGRLNVRRPSGAPVVGQRRAEAGRPIAGVPDWALIAAVIALTLVGLVFVFSASFAVGQRLYGDPQYFAMRQVVGAAIGLFAFLFFATLDYRRWRGLSPLLMVVGVLGLMAVLIPGVGHEQNGARRWIQIGDLPALQPSEFIKFALLLYVAAWLASRGDAIKQFTLGLVPFSLIVGFVGALIMLEPDLGTALTISVLAVAMFFLAGAAWRHMGLLVAGGGTVLLGIILLFGYGVDRFTQFVAAEEQAETGGFQILQLMIALGSGGLTGVGLGESRQKFFYVPSAHTDGVFAIIGEETGLLGALIVLTLFAFFIYRAIRVGMRAPDTFGTLLAFGIVAWIGTQAFFNIGGVTRSIPLTGIPLPFISFGSSALIAVLAASGLLVSISRYGLQADPYRAEPSRSGKQRRDYAAPPRLEDHEEVAP